MARWPPAVQSTTFTSAPHKPVCVQGEAASLAVRHMRSAVAGLRRMRSAVAGPRSSCYQAPCRPRSLAARCWHSRLCQRE